MPPQLLVDRVAAALELLSGRARRAATTLLEAAAGPDGAVTVTRELVTALLAVIEQAGGAAAQLAADLVLTQLDVWGLEAAVVQAPGVDQDRAAARLRWAGTTPDVTGNVLGIVDELVKQPYRSTIADSAVASKVGWARVPTGPTTCGFCLMLASRGGTYTSEAAAGGGYSGKKYHPHCDCVAVLVRGPRDYPPGYDPDKLYKRYRSGNTGYPPVRIGTRQPPFSAKNRPGLSSGAWSHVVDRHRSPGRWPNKPKFPPDWTDAEVQAAIDQTLIDADAVEHLGDAFRFYATVRGQRIGVVVRTDKPRPFIWTAYPVIE